MRRILYVEDNADLLALVQRLIELSVPDTVVDVCATSAGAELLLNRECYDLVICDLKLQPGELGTTIIERILERDVEQPVMLMTAYGWGTCDENFVRGEVDRITERFKRPVPLMKKFNESSPADFLLAVNSLLAEKFCSGRAAARPSRSTSRPPGRLRLTSDCVRAARRAVAA